MPNTSNLVPPDEAKRLILEKLRLGWTVARCMEYVGKSEKTYEYYSKSDPEFKSEVLRIRKRASGVKREVPDFPDFCEHYLGMKLFNHQLQWFDLIEGRTPRNLHSTQRYERAGTRFRRMYICNTPPDHAKTTTMSVAYSTWRILRNPSIRILIISKTQDLAKDILSAIKDRIDSRVPQFDDLKIDLCPPEGLEHSSTEWRQDRIRVNPSLITRLDTKDPTCQAKGIGQQIYGKRADVIIMDDCVDLNSVHQFEADIKWTQKEVQSRLVEGGVLLIVGTRLASQDFYSELMRSDRYPRSIPPYTYLTQPAVLELADDPADWVTLWPKSNIPPSNLEELDYIPTLDADGLYDHFTGTYMDELRSTMNPTDWAMVYMQQQVNEHSVFNLEDINACTNGRRFPGLIVGGRPGHRPEGMAGLYIVAGIDPAASGYTAAVVMGVDRQSGKRYLLDVFNKSGCRPAEMNSMMKAWTTRYGILEWRCESNAVQALLWQDDDLQKWMRSRGVLLSEHHTGKNKWDSQWGVATMANLFRGHENDGNMIELPSRKGQPAVQTLVEQLVTWFPTSSASRAPTQDCVMAMWFAEIRCRELADEMDSVTHWESKYVSDRDRENQVVVDLDWWAARQQFESKPVPDARLPEWIRREWGE